MKKILHKLRVWLLKLLGGVPSELEKTAFETVLEENAKLYKEISDRDRDYELLRMNVKALKMKVKALKTVIREICRRSETSYYDWCCEYCGQELIKCRHNGWCRFFAPAMDREDGGINE